MKRIKQILIIGLITYFLIELMCFTVIKTGFIKANLPHFFSNANDTTIFPFTYADINPYWGVWHYSRPVKINNGCIWVECTPNEAGARDKERAKQSNDTNRIVVLGDSFMEGYGIPVANRVSDQLEISTGHEFLNFACSDMGSTQEYLIYKNLAAKYDHNTVLLGILPKNDFVNDSKLFDSIQTPLRYKPYWTGTSPDMHIEYYTDNISKSQFTYDAFKEYKQTRKYKARYVLENTTCWFNVLYYISKRREAALYIKKKARTDKPYSGFYDFSNDELLRLKKSLVEIRKLSTGKRMIIFTIPVEKDFERYNLERQTKNNIPLLVKELQRFAVSNNIIYHDLLTSATAEELNTYRRFYFNCDEHWNIEGHKWAYQKLLPLFTK